MEGIAAVSYTHLDVYKRQAVKSPKYLQEVMGIGRIAENGIFEVGKGIYSKTYRFLDINYRCV